MALKHAVHQAESISKSQIAIEFSHQYRANHPDHWVFWVHASTTDRFLQAYQEIARTVQAPGDGDPKVDVFQCVKNWLTDARNGHWLMIVDNADDPSIFFAENEGSGNKRGQDNHIPLSSYVPQSPHGAVVITSRNDTGADIAGGLDEAETVGQFDDKTAIELLSKKSPKLSMDDNATKLVQLLDHIPLAIVQASANTQKTRTTIARYLAAFLESEEKQRNLLSKVWADIRRDPKVPNTVITSWKISFNQIERTSEAAVKVPSLMSMLDRHGIPETLLSLDDIHGFDLDEAVGVLLEYCFISRGGHKGSYSMHRLVQLAMRTWLEDVSKLPLWTRIAVQNLSKGFPNGSLENWTTCEIVLPHAQKVLSYHDQLRKIVDQAELLQNLVWYYIERGDYGKAETLYGWALAEREKQLGLEHIYTLRAVHDLAVVYQNQGRYDEAELLRGRFLDHPSIGP